MPQVLESRDKAQRYKVTYTVLLISRTAQPQSIVTLGRLVTEVHTEPTLPLLGNLTQVTTWVAS